MFEDGGRVHIGDSPIIVEAQMYCVCIGSFKQASAVQSSKPYNVIYVKAMGRNATIASRT